MHPLLELLEHVGEIPFIHRNVTTVDGVLDLLRRWRSSEYATYPVAYLSFHGEPGAIQIDDARLTLEDLAEELAGACRNRDIYFGSCGVLEVPRRRIDAFRTRTGVRSVSGFTRPVDWVESAGFDLQLLGALTRYRRVDAVERRLRENYRSVTRALGFRLYHGH